MFDKVEGGDYHEYYYADHYHRRVDPVVRRGWRLLLEETTLGVTSYTILTPWRRSREHLWRGGENMLVIRTNNQYDYVDDFLLDSLIKSNEIVKFKRNRAWVTVGIAPIRANKRDRVCNGADRLAINDSIFVREYRKASS